MNKHVVVIGAGFGGLSAAAYLARAGYRVTVYEQTDQPGGRALVLQKGGFTFDMGPSWYMMPDVFEEFFADFGHKTSDLYRLRQLDPSYRVFTPDSHFDSAPYPKVKKLFKAKDPDSVEPLSHFMAQTKTEYCMLRRKVLNKPMLSAREVLDTDILRMLLSSKSIRSFHSQAAKVTKSRDLQQMMEFMSVFMGGSPQNIPALYSLLSYVDMGLGVWYPDGGFGVVARAFETVAKEQGVKIIYNAPVQKIKVKNGRVQSIRVRGREVTCDAVVSNADYALTETKLLPRQGRSYPQSYWQKKTVSPSATLLFLGVKKPVPNLLHHNLFFDTDWDRHFNEIFKKKQWSEEPLLYVCVPSKSDTSVAPKGQENIFILAPSAPGIEPTKPQLTKLTQNVITRLEQKSGTKLADNIVLQEVRTQKYFIETFGAYKGNAFGLSHTLPQSAIFRPKMVSPKLNNLFYVGQYTNPGTGVPMVVLSGKVAADQLRKRLA